MWGGGRGGLRYGGREGEGEGEGEGRVCSAHEMGLEGRTEGERLVGLLGVDGWMGGWIWMDESQGKGAVEGEREREGGRIESSLTLVVHVFIALLVGVHDI